MANIEEVVAQLIASKDPLFEKKRAENIAYEKLVAELNSELTFLAKEVDPLAAMRVSFDHEQSNDTNLDQLIDKLKSSAVLAEKTTQGIVEQLAKLEEYIRNSLDEIYVKVSKLIQVNEKISEFYSAKAQAYCLLDERCKMLQHKLDSHTFVLEERKLMIRKHIERNY